jgi:hypothetical protein
MTAAFARFAADFAAVMTTATVQCPRCRVSVPIDKVDMPNRCPDRACPLNKEPPMRPLGHSEPELASSASLILLELGLIVALVVAAAAVLKFIFG